MIADFRSGNELHSFGGHLFHPPIDDVLLQLELRNSVAQQPANAVRLFVDHNRVSGAA